MPLSSPTSVPSLGAVEDRRRNAPVHPACQVANGKNGKIFDMIDQAQRANWAMRTCAKKDCELTQLLIELLEYLNQDEDNPPEKDLDTWHGAPHKDKDKDGAPTTPNGAPQGGAPTTPKRRRKPTQRQRRARRAAATAVLQAAVQGWRGRREAARLREAAAARVARSPAAVQAPLKTERALRASSSSPDLRPHPHLGFQLHNGPCSPLPWRFTAPPLPDTPPH